MVELKAESSKMMVRVEPVDYEPNRYLKVEPVDSGQISTTLSIHRVSGLWEDGLSSAALMFFCRMYKMLLLLVKNDNPSSIGYAIASRLVSMMKN